MSFIAYQIKSCGAKDHGKSYIKVIPPLVRQLLRNRLSRVKRYSCSLSLNDNSVNYIHEELGKIQSPEELRGVLFIVRAGNDIIKADFMHTRGTIFPSEMKIGIHLEELK